MTPEEKLDRVYETVIRLESVCRDVEALKKWRDGNGIPGAKFQLWVLWAAFVAVLGKMWSAK